MKKYFLTLALLYAYCFSFGQLPTPLSIELTPYITSGITDPIGIEFHGNRMFIVERDGKIKMSDDGNILPYTFLNISAKVSSGGERGLLGFAFDPDFDLNRTIYVNYTNTVGNSVIAAYVADDDSLFVNPLTETIFFTVNQPYSNHNGGRIQFGPDGYLYIGFGDGGLANDPENRAQNPQLMLGKMLRIDVDANGYSIPPDNPFVNNTDTLPEIWALGLRNPWRFTFDSQTGDLWIGDVGQELFEEIDFQPAGSAGGHNYGWRCYEGFHVFNAAGCGPASSYDFPVAEYSHGGGNCSITGGYVYRGTDSELLNGVYLYIDFCTGNMAGLADITNDPISSFNLGSFGFGYSTFGQDENGEMYMARLPNAIYKLNDPCHSQFPILTFESSLLTVTEGQNYYWFLNDELIEGQTENTYSPVENGVYYCNVENEFGCVIKSNSIDVLSLGLNELNTPAFNIYPNPAKRFFTIDGDLNKIMGFKLYSTVGKMVWERNAISGDMIELPSGLNPGYYIITLVLKDKSTVSKRLIIE